MGTASRSLRDFTHVLRRRPEFLKVRRLQVRLVRIVVGIDLKNPDTGGKHSETSHGHGPFTLLVECFHSRARFCGAGLKHDPAISGSSPVHNEPKPRDCLASNKGFLRDQAARGVMAACRRRMSSFVPFSRLELAFPHP